MEYGAHSYHQTALSQYRNLLFVAYVDQVYVYAPSFPEQIIKTRPELIIGLPKSRPDLTGYLDKSKPHAVNHLIVGEIGNEEVVVVACDDGDVISYFVRSISLAIDERVKLIVEPGSLPDQLSLRSRQEGRENMILPDVNPDQIPGCRPLAAWFHENVGASAWGLAMHRLNALLAVSSNTRNIHVFAPAFNPATGPEAFNEMDKATETIERYTAWETRSKILLRDRTLGRKITLQGHRSNIPNIAFCDSTLDPEANYLASTDISGYTAVWNIWRWTRILELLQNSDFRKSNKIPLVALVLIPRNLTRLGRCLLGSSNFET